MPYISSVLHIIINQISVPPSHWSKHHTIRAGIGVSKHPKQTVLLDSLASKKIPSPLTITTNARVERAGKTEHDYTALVHLIIYDGRMFSRRSR